MSDAEYVEFVQARSPALLRTACLLTAGDRHAAEDLLQTALAQTFVAWRRIREPAAREAYVRKILIRTAVRHHRRRGMSAEQLVSDPPAATTGDQATRVDEHLSLWPLLRALTPRQRAVIVLRYYEDLTEAQIAEVLRCAPGTVKVHAHRALETLRSRLGPEFAVADSPQNKPEEP